MEYVLVALGAALGVLLYQSNQPDAQHDLVYAGLSRKGSVVTELEQGFKDAPRDRIGAQHLANKYSGARFLYFDQDMLDYLRSQ